MMWDFHQWYKERLSGEVSDEKVYPSTNETDIMDNQGKLLDFVNETKEDTKNRDSEEREREKKR